MEIAYLFLGLIVGGLALFFLVKNSFQSKLDAAKAITDEKQKVFEQSSFMLRDEINSLKKEIHFLNEKNSVISNQLSVSQTENKSLQEKWVNSLEEQKQLQQKLTTEFENLANKIMDEKGKKFSEQNEHQLKHILDPLKERIHLFEKKIHDTHIETEKDRSALKQQIQMLTELNHKMSAETLNLTKALKGDSKKQGNWGEMIMEKILEKSGLVKGREFDLQVNMTAEDGSRSIPDAVIRLPENKNLIVDAKVSLVAYDRYVATDDADNEAQALHLNSHIASVRNHIKNLSSKNYPSLYNIQSPDFVMLFIPIESAFSLAIANDNELYSDAFEKNVVLVSPTTLLASLRTIANIWKQEYTNKNVLEIARVGGDLYDKFVGFFEDLKQVGKKMDDSKEAYTEAMKKLYEGKGNMVRKVETLKELGAKASKSLPPNLLDRSKDTE